ncbi:MAG: Replicative DNA helicase, partial [Candidatus Peregrinibacteria bacterium GW2011_GWA2_47_7]
ALNIAQNVARHNKTVGIISLEMSKEQLVERMFCALLAVDSWKMRTGRLNDEDFARIGSVMDDLNKTNIFIDDTAGNSLTELRTKARRLKAEHGLDMLIVDYLQMMSIGKPVYQSNRVQEISEISRSLKNLARELHLPIIALSQLSRAVESRPSKIPQLSDLRESGAIEQDADVVLMMYREDYYEEDTDRKGLTDIFIRKHRNGPTGHIELMFEKEKMRFFDLERQRETVF